MDSEFPLHLQNSFFINNSINVEQNSLYGGNPCINTMNFFNILLITNCLFKNNQAFDQSNCINFVGIDLHVNNTIFQEMKPISKKPYLGNLGALSISVDNVVIFNVSFLKNQAFKAAAIFLRNVALEKQKFYCENVSYLLELN